MSLNRSKVLVTGAGGFIGSHLTERLLALGASVRAIVHYNALGTWGWLDGFPSHAALEVVAGDICDADWVRRVAEGCEVIFHLAALIAIPYSYHAPRSYVRTNVEGTLNILQAAREWGVRRVIHTSTSEVYGTARYVPIDEAHPLQGQSPYSATKIAADKLVESYFLSFDLPVVTVRPFNTYGPRQSSRAIVPTIITQALTQPQIRLGNLTASRDLSYVADTVEGFILAASSSQAVGQVVNIGPGLEITIADLAEKIVRLTGRPIPVISEESRLRPRASEVGRLCADNRKARELLGWQPQSTLDDGLLGTIRWMEQNLERYRIGQYVL